MSWNDKITTCITMGLRPDLLQETFESLSPELQSLPIVAINDFGDTETNDMFHSLWPNGTLIDKGGRIGHTKAIDAIYEHVKTPYVFHIEDDWGFTNCDFVQPAIDVLDADSDVSMVCLRALADFKLKPEKAEQVMDETVAGHLINRMDNIDPDWHGYTFNPHISRLSLWKEIGGFSQFRGEKKVSIHFRQMGKHVAYLQPGYCGHIGGGASARRRKDEAKPAPKSQS